MPRAKRQTRPVNVPVRVIGSKPAAPAVPTPAPTRPSAAPVKTPTAIERWPIEKRRRWMWGIVAIGMFGAILLWGLSLGAELRQVGRGSSLWTDLSDIFRTFDQDSQRLNPKQEEIRQLERDVFPQFQ